MQIPVAIAADLFATLLLTRVFPLEVSAFVVRGLWLAASAVVVASVAVARRTVPRGRARSCRGPWSPRWPRG